VNESCSCRSRAYVKFVARNLTGSPADKARALDAIRLVGPESTVIPGDAGLTGSPNHTDALAQPAKVLRQAGFDEAARTATFKQNPARLIKLPVL
jgi:hypothetical protein